MKQVISGEKFEESLIDDWLNNKNGFSQQILPAWWTVSFLKISWMAKDNLFY